MVSLGPYIGRVCPLDTCPESNLVDVPGDRLYLVPREIACTMQRIQKESPVPVDVRAETFARQFYVFDVLSQRRTVVTFEFVEDQGIVGVVDFVCALLDRHSEVVLADAIKEEVGVIGTASLQVTNRRRIVIRKDSEETGYEERFI